MKIIHLSIIAIIALCGVAACNQTIEGVKEKTSVSADPLPSWNEGELKKAIIGYVAYVTDSTGKGYIPPIDRIATFDNDGTLWAERPYVQELFAYFRVKQMVEKNPQLASQQPFKAVLEHDKAYFEKGGEKAMTELIGATHANLPEAEFEKAVADFFAGVKYPTGMFLLNRLRISLKLNC